MDCRCPEHQQYRVHSGGTDPWCRVRVCGQVHQQDWSQRAQSGVRQTENSYREGWQLLHHDGALQRQTHPHCDLDWLVLKSLCGTFLPTEEADVDLDVPMSTQYTVRAGRDVEVFIPLKGRPTPGVTWRRGERNIAADTRYTITSTERATTLLIPKVTRDDCGKYLLEIENGVGEPKIITVSLKVLDSPSTCQKLMVKNVTRGKLTLSWEAPLIDGGSPITKYIVEKKGSTMKAYQMVTDECVSTSYKVSGLEEDIAYFFRVSAENEFGVGDACETSEPVRATETPGAVKDLVMLDSTRSSVTLQWTRPDHDGGSHISEYVIEKRNENNVSWTFATTCKRCTCEVTGLQEDSEMNFRVYAKNEKGTSDFSQIGPITVMDFIIPPEACLGDYPNGELAVRVGQNIHIELPFKGKPRPAISWTTDNKTVTVLGPPSVPVGPIHFDEIKAQNVIISWNEPKEDGGGEITCYSVEKRETSQANWKMVCSSVVRTSFKVPNLVKGTVYQFRVRAENKYGVSEPLISTEVLAQHQYKPPGAPGKPVAYNVTSDGTTIRWEAPGFDGGSPILGYHVEKKDRNSLLWQKVNSTIISNKEYRVISLLEGLEYSFRVYAENNAGFSPVSEQSKHALAISPVAVPEAPGTPDSTHLTGNSITLCWTRPRSDGGNEIKHYILERREKKSLRWVKVSAKRPITELRHRVTHLTEGNEYEFRVMAENGAGVGPASGTSRLFKCREPTSSPSAPTVIKVS
uniref:Fibronectin type-III domain-containing protein n=1 Tax=Hippocampus comes TaxID=109280 RepID=A0A3Q3DIQ6_HIPCM